MNDSFIVLLCSIYSRLLDEGKDGYIVIKSTVAVKALFRLYEKLSLIDVPTIETLPLEAKTKYWEIAKQTYTELEFAKKASKAAYMISLITNTD